MAEEKKVKKKAFILEALEKLGPEAPTSKIVSYVQDKHGIEVTENYAYSVKKGLTGNDKPAARRGRRPGPQPKADAPSADVFSFQTVEAAHALIDSAGGIDAARQAIQYVQRERQLQDDLVTVWEERIASLVTKAESLANGDLDREAAEKQIETLRERINGVRKVGVPEVPAKK